MARCMLCSSPVADGDPVCPHCGGAVEADPSGTQGPFAVEDPTRADATTAAPDPFAPPTAGSWAPGGAPPPAWQQPPAAPSSWTAPVGSATGPHGAYGGPYGSPPPGYGPPPAPGYYVPPPPPPGGYAPYYSVPVGPIRPTEGLATAAFVTALVGLLLTAGCGVTILACPVGAVMGHVALRRIAESGNQGRGMALAGVIIGWVGTGLLLIGIGLLVAITSASAT